MVVMINCRGTPFEMGLAHGKYAKQQINNMIELYRGYFMEWNGLDWDELKELAKAYDVTLKEKVDFLYEEMGGIAKGADVDILDIILLNARYELGLAGNAAQRTKKDLAVIDGCTTFGCKTGGEQWVAQNWDWQSEVLPNMVYLNLEPADTSLPRMKVVCEAGLLGQTGFNNYGVSVVVNALHATILDTSKIPCMVIRRAMLAQKSVKDALKVMEGLGVSALSHILIADNDDQVSIETSPIEPSFIYPVEGKLTHSNHCVATPKDIEEVTAIGDSQFRLGRIRQLLDGVAVPSREEFVKILSDTEGFPNSINRYNDKKKIGGTGSYQTCYTTIINSTKKCAQITFGNPTEPIYKISVGFGISEEGVEYANK